MSRNLSQMTETEVLRAGLESVKVSAGQVIDWQGQPRLCTAELTREISDTYLFLADRQRDSAAT